MRLNHKTFPAYSLLESGNLHSLQIDNMFKEDYAKTIDDLVGFTKAIATTYSLVRNRYYLTNTFRDAISKAMPKIQEGNKHLKDLPTDCGIIFSDAGFTIYLSLPADKKLKFICYGFTRDTLTTMGYLTNDDKFGGIAASTLNNKPYNDKYHLADYINTVMMAVYFINKCEVETKILQPNEKYREGGNKHYNESKSDVKILDCRWFTELIRTTPFNVSGHFRRQAYGENFSKRKLKWINNFEKKGYHRKAGKGEPIKNEEADNS